MNIAVQQVNLRWIENQFTECRMTAARLSLLGWPGDANYYRRQAIKARRFVFKIRGALSQEGGGE